MKKFLLRQPIVVNTYFSLISLWKYPAFLSEYFKFKNEGKNSKRGFKMNFKNIYPSLFDKTVKQGFDRHYTLHPAWAARILAKIKPAKHYDFSSSTAFNAYISAFVPIMYHEFRSSDLGLSNLEQYDCDLVNLEYKDCSLKSISCMHVIEHIGLGRYGDKMDYEGDLKAINELKRVLAKNGDLLFVVPVGKPVIMYNSHRVYSYDQIMSYFSDLKLMECALIPMLAKKGNLLINPKKELFDSEEYGCGCFWFKKI